jgi:hypothetical protein
MLPFGFPKNHPINGISNGVYCSKQNVTQNPNGEHNRCRRIRYDTPPKKENRKRKKNAIQNSFGLFVIVHHPKIFNQIP